MAGLLQVIGRGMTTREMTVCITMESWSWDVYALV